MIGFLFFLALQPILCKTECRVNLRYMQVVYSCQISLHVPYRSEFWRGKILAANPVKY